MAPLEPWEKVLVDRESFPATVHGLIACIDCHGGAQSPDKEIAHEGMVRNPSSDYLKSCGSCHPNIVANAVHMLHDNLAGYWTVLNTRELPAEPVNADSVQVEASEEFPEGELVLSSTHPALEEMFDNHCDSCHATCGECHVSQPDLVGGGFIDGHNFNRSPSMTRNCTACHGSRVGNEYLGKHEGLLADVHFRQGRMNCVDCHSGSVMHGEPAECKACHESPEKESVPPADHRYSGIQSPRCESCHTSAATGQDDIKMHQVHGANLSCQVCHSLAYTSCDGCHVAISETTGNPYYSTEASYLAFIIGRNPLPSYERPYDFVPLRHVPISPDSFSFYGDNLLPSFDHLETWKYTTPHNIQLNTPQAESCNACHGNADLFLTGDKVADEELNANQDVIVETVPPTIPTPAQIP